MSQIDQNWIDQSVYAPIPLSQDFPVSVPHHVIRTDELWDIQPHLHDCLELGYCYRGEGIFLIEDKILPFRGSDAIIINHRERHIMVGNRGSPAEWDFINLNPGLLLSPFILDEDMAHFLVTDSFCGSYFPNLFTCQQNQEVCAIIYNIMRELNQQRVGYQVMTRWLVGQLLITLHRLFPNLSQKGKDSSSEEKDIFAWRRINPALSYLATHYDQPISLAQLAQRCHVSVPHFRRLFYQATRMSPHFYLQLLRLKMAAVTLIHSSRSVEEIAELVGFSSVPHFIRIFKRKYHLTPGEYRKKHVLVNH